MALCETCRAGGRRTCELRETWNGAERITDALLKLLDQERSAGGVLEDSEVEAETYQLKINRAVFWVERRLEASNRGCDQLPPFPVYAE
ncbi:hypothetical protein HY086_05090 [Candidatus Gottesmanbacteria bacterium]|nr:hypothetical protein [Candidatus Gottesmanbacteria bacterium]